MPAQESTQHASSGRQSLPRTLLDASCYDHPTSDIQLVETHISWVLLTGQYAYKIKKPLKLGFLDFSTLGRRRHFCLEELRLNRRLAPELYIDVVPIGGTPTAPRMGRNPAFEYAVKMRQFDAHARLDRQILGGALDESAVDRFAGDLAQFHGTLKPIRDAGSARAAIDAAVSNIDELARYMHDEHDPALDRLRRWTQIQAHDLGETFSARVAQGAYRECHGDLHLENLLLLDRRIVAYDALEFDPKLREIDVASEIAFLAMDFMAHARTELAYRFLNRYLETTGDYSAIDVLRYYLVYRALVRAKVGAIKRAQEHKTITHDPHFDTALALSKPEKPLLLITHGLSGSGKTSVTDRLIGRLPALRVRSDIERKRLLGLDAAARTSSGVGRGAYGADITTRTYEQLAHTADRALRHGFNVIVDATFLQRRERWDFRQLAAANAARFAILDCVAPIPELRRRVVERGRRRDDASEATTEVLDQQLRSQAPLERAERNSVVRVDTGRGYDLAAIVRELAAR